VGLLSILGCKNKTQKENSISSTQENVFSIPYLGNLKLAATKDLEAEIKINNIEVSVGLNFNEDITTKKKIENVKEVLDHIDKYLEKANNKIKNNFDNNGVVKDYFNHHNEVVPEIKKLYNNEKEFLRELVLTRIDFYPEDENHYVIFGFSIGQEITDYIVVVRFDGDLKINSVDFVS
jgi:hypothetical protein